MARVQDYLNRLGYRVPEHGAVDTRSTESIRDFEQAQGLVVTGIPDAVVLDSLIEEFNRRDNEAWAQAGDAGTEAAYQQYAQSFPKGRYVEQVDGSIAAARERAAWAAARGADTEAAYRQYAEAYPAGAYADQIEEQLARVQAEAQRHRDEAAAAARQRELVRAVQNELKRLGRKVTVDGALGQDTRDQVRAFERATDRTESGAPTDALLAALQATERWPGLEPGKRFRDCHECPEMVVLPGGSLRMGSPAGEPGRADDEGPQHNVAIRPFALATKEVTVAEFRRFVEASGYRTDAEQNAGGASGCYSRKADGSWGYVAGRSWRDPGFRQGAEHPAVCLSWNDAQEYMRWLRAKTGEDYRLPSEAEQEYALRAGSTTTFPWGSSADGACRHGNVMDQTVAGVVSAWVYAPVACTDDQVFTAPVASYVKNEFGLYDMTGNALEWAQDCWNESYRGAPSDGTAWMGGDCGHAVLRGGSWGHFGYGQFLRSANRDGSARGSRDDITRFRLARSVTL